MQTQKDEVRRQILLVAKEEFFEKGVKRTSMKTIAQKAGIAVGNIYNYYKGKDELFRAVLAPLFKAFKDYHERSFDTTYTSIDIFRYEKYNDMMHQQVASLIIPFRKELRLLIFHSAGTSVEHYFDTELVHQAQYGMDYIAQMKAYYPDINTDVSPHFIRILCELWSGLIKTIVTNEDISEEELSCIIANYVKFGMGGWKNLMNIK